MGRSMSAANDEEWSPAAEQLSALEPDQPLGRVMPDFLAYFAKLSSHRDFDFIEAWTHD